MSEGKGGVLRGDVVGEGLRIFGHVPRGWCGQHSGDEVGRAFRHPWQIHTPCCFIQSSVGHVGVCGRCVLMCCMSVVRFDMVWQKEEIGQGMFRDGGFFRNGVVRSG